MHFPDGFALLLGSTIISNFMVGAALRAHNVHTYEMVNNFDRMNSKNSADELNAKWWCWLVTGALKILHQITVMCEYIFLFAFQSSSSSSLLFVFDFVCVCLHGSTSGWIRSEHMRAHMQPISFFLFLFVFVVFVLSCAVFIGQVMLALIFIKVK